MTAQQQVSPLHLHYCAALHSCALECSLPCPRALPGPQLSTRRLQGLPEGRDTLQVTVLPSAPFDHCFLFKCSRCNALNAMHSTPRSDLVLLDEQGRRGRLPLTPPYSPAEQQVGPTAPALFCTTLMCAGLCHSLPQGQAGDTRPGGPDTAGDCAAFCCVLCLFKCPCCNSLYHQVRAGAAG